MYQLKYFDACYQNNFEEFTSVATYPENLVNSSVSDAMVQQVVTQVGGGQVAVQLFGHLPSEVVRVLNEWPGT